jgi:hypothetical protein
LLRGLIGTPETKAESRARERGLEQLRERSAGPSAALRSSREPVLDYLLGAER